VSYFWVLMFSVWFFHSLPLGFSLENSNLLSCPWRHYWFQDMCHKTLDGHFNSQETQSKWACMILVFIAHIEKVPTLYQAPIKIWFLPPNCTLDLHKILTNTSKHLGHFFHDFSNLSTCWGKKQIGTSKLFYYSLLQKKSNELKIIEFGQCLILQPLI